MRLVEALGIVKSAKRRDADPFSVFLATGLNPLHLSTFLAAELSQAFADRKIELQHGLYGDLLGNVSRLAKASAEAGIVLLEWADLDARLGIRSSSAWSPAVCNDIVATVKARASQLQPMIEAAAQRMPVMVSFPTLPLPPASFVPGWQAGSLEIELNGIMHSLRSKIAQRPQVRIPSAQKLEMVSPLRERFDVESELLAGFPYRLPHASALANLLAQLTRKPNPKKGLITDLDDTLWRGILGEVGVEGISWDLDHHTQMHAFYQRVLAALGAEGVLLGIASKNERALVESALGRKDLALSSDVFFPLEVSWGRKSDAVARILKAWNVGADSVVFVDDSALELAEVKASHPDVECIQFPTKDSTAIYELALRLRDLFGKSAILEEDAIRARSIRRSQESAEAYQAANSAPANFLEQVEAEISLNFSKAPLDPRALELVNKTNQFNLNGKRFTEAAWQNYLREPDSFLAVASYTDKFGPLGKIAVIAGRQNGTELRIDAWVVSCRAFSRRIERTCLQEVFSRFGADSIKLDFVKTERNGPLRQFLEELLGAAPEPGCVITRQLFESRSKDMREPQEITNG
ncbi:MAG TPA: HAD-IIIC family phosphatase [Candidatus Dormibacteraeota bacterium]|nr:HAD-IIIC family phosphatase [Candidatus Dormibacteraeota bacterium]